MLDQRNLEEIAETILRKNLALAREERYLFFTDFNSRWEERLELLVERRRFLHRLYESFESCRSHFPRALHDKYESTKLHGSEPGENIWRLAFGESIYGRLVSSDLLWKLKAEVDLEDAEWVLVDELIDRFREEIVSCVVAFPWYSVTHTRFRRLLNGAGCRFVSMPLLTESVMSGPMQADWDDVATRTERLHSLLLKAKSLHLTCEAGSDFKVEIGKADNVHKDTGLFHNAGSFGNLPAGEAYLVPRKGSAAGTIVFTSGPEIPSVEPTPALVEEGKVVEFGEETTYAETLERKFEGDFHIRHIAELGIGTNPLARDVSSMIEGEKIRGTVHVALGDDSSIGGANEATEHLDHIIVNCSLSAELVKGGTVDIVLDGELLV